MLFLHVRNMSVGDSFMVCSNPSQYYQVLEMGERKTGPVLSVQHVRVQVFFVARSTGHITPIDVRSMDFDDDFAYPVWRKE